ncbi:hypothetical protein EV363DRAFT_1256750 [Boletus edulis]|nr:hypothetical protein EV363DRAFT_1256750 [Boletus edulis]
MSSCGNPSTDQDALMPRRLRFNKGKDCIKCKANPGKIVIRHAVYCKECFIPLVMLKFRRSLEPSVNASAGTSKRPKLKASGSLVLGFSGGLGSSILLDMVHKTYFVNESSANGEARGGTNHPRSASVWTSCAVCYVEVCSAFPETRDRTNEIIKALAPYPKFDFIPLRLEYAFDDSWWRSITTTDQDRSQLTIELGKDGLYTEALRHGPSCDLSPVDALRTYLASLPTQTAISSAIRILVRLLLLYTARSHRASHLLLGTSLTTLSISLISCISQGGGHSIREEFQEEWYYGIPATAENADAIRVVRPLRDVTMKECSMFAWWNSIHVVGRDGQIRATAGIPGLTKDFIVGLEKDYPSTVSTIARTCAKLEPKNASPGLCILCQRPIQEGLDDWKTRISIRSYSDAKLGPDLVYLPTPVPPNSSDVTMSDQCPSISKQLCYSCRTTLTSRGSRAAKPTQPRVIHSTQQPLSAPLPLWVSASCAQLRTEDRQLMVLGNGEVWVGKRQDDATQRNEIAEFLLDT